MKIIADMHTHTNVSHHAFNTLYEMTKGAFDRGFRAMAITNHAPELPDSAHPWHFPNLRHLPRVINGVFMIRGVELNILPEGQDYVIRDSFSTLDFIIASFHSPVFPADDIDAHTKALYKVLSEPAIDLLGHMGADKHKFDYEDIISKCNRFDKCVEINNHSFKAREGSADNCREIALLCKQYRVPIFVNSDAHSLYDIGAHENAGKMLSDIGFPEELIINADKDRFIAYFKRKKNLDIVI